MFHVGQRPRMILEDLLEETRALKKELLRSQQENQGLRKRLLCALNPRVQLHRIDAHQLFVQQWWSSSLDQGLPKHPHIKEEQEDVWICPKGEQFHDVKESVRSQDAEAKVDPSQLYTGRSDGKKATDTPSNRTTEIKGRSGSITLHVRIHARHKRVACSVCGKKVGSDAIKRHLRTHTGEKPFTCLLCGKKFAYKCTLKLHMRTHTGERPYGCSLCGKTFAQDGHLKRHMRTHTGERPYSCSVCGKAFAEDGALRRHMAIHSEERPYSCSVCNKKFGRVSDLKRHLNTHITEKTFGCSVCNKKFVCKFYLSRHLKIHKQ